MLFFLLTVLKLFNIFMVSIFATQERILLVLWQFLRSLNCSASNLPDLNFLEKLKSGRIILYSIQDVFLNEELDHCPLWRSNDARASTFSQTAWHFLLWYPESRSNSSHQMEQSLCELSLMAVIIVDLLLIFKWCPRTHLCDQKQAKQRANNTEQQQKKLPAVSLSEVGRVKIC